MWEDPQNKDGGRWVLNIDKRLRNQNLDIYWLNTVRPQRLDWTGLASQLARNFNSYWFLFQLLALIGDQFEDEGPYVNGAYINIRGKGDKLSLWTKSAKEAETQMKIGSVATQLSQT